VWQGPISGSMLAEIRRHFILAVVVVAIVMVVVSSIAHIKASTRMVPVPMSFADSNSNAADSDIGAFRDDHWFVADVQRTGKCRHRQKRNKKKGKHSSLHAFSWVGRSASRCLAECALGFPVVCPQLTTAVLESRWKNVVLPALIEQRVPVALPA
jgi:hypothetical protein